MKFSLTTIFRFFIYTLSVCQVSYCAPYKTRCAKSILNYNGVEILLGESLVGKIVVLYLMKRRCERHCFSQLQGLNDLGSFYNATGHPVKIVALKPRNSPSISHFKPYVPFVRIYEEPPVMWTNNIPLIRLLRFNGDWKEMLIYGQCGEQRFHYGYPYSSLEEPFINYAVLYTLTFPKECTPC